MYTIRGNNEKREKEWDVELGHSKQFCGYFKFLLQFTGTPSKTRAVKKFGHTHKKIQSKALNVN